MSADSTRDAIAPPRTDAGREPLNCTVVHYENAPDRCTVAPPDVDGDRQFTAWLSVNADALVPLGEMR
jgi:hypothetical protein